MMAMGHDIKVLGRKIHFDADSITLPALPEDRFPAPSSLALDVSGRCNLRCRYCAESATMPLRPMMPIDMVRRSVDSLFEWSGKGGVSIHFGSGEPLLNPEAVHEAGRRARERARREGRPLSLHLTTNGTLLDDETIGWLLEDGWNVKVSIDGDKRTHDSYRVASDGSGTYRRIVKHVRSLAEAIPEHFSTTSVLCHGTDPSDVFMSMSRLGVRNIEIVPVAAPEGSPLNLTEDDLKRYERFVLELARRLADGEDAPNLISFRKRLQKALGHGNTPVACGAGRNFFAIGPDGTVFPCFRFVGIQEYRLGEIGRGIERESVRRFTERPGRPLGGRSECEGCWASKICGGPCFAVAELMRGGEAPASQCSMVKAEAKAVLWLADSLRGSDPGRLVALMGVRIDD